MKPICKATKMNRPTSDATRRPPLIGLCALATLLQPHMGVQHRIGRKEVAAAAANFVVPEIALVVSRTLLEHDNAPARFC